MESKILDEQIEWESRRVAAAFGVAQWHSFQSAHSVGGIGADDFQILWTISRELKCLEKIVLGDIELQECVLSLRNGRWLFYIGNRSYVPAMAHALCRLGIKDEAVLKQLNYPLTAHEKMELCLSMPREFRPPNCQHEAHRE